MKIIERIYDASTGETKDIERTATAMEISEAQTAMALAEEKENILTELLSKRENALAKLKELGLTADDVKALGI